jgi:S1-C subfamily serine protease
MNIYIKAMIACALIVFSGCAQQAVVRNAPPRRLEVTIPGQTKKDVTDALVSAMVSRDFAVVNITEYTAVFSKTLAQPAVSRAKKTARSVPSEQRVSFTIVTAGNGVKLVLIPQIVSNPGSPYERITEASGGAAGDNWQEFLNTFPNAFRGRIGVALNWTGTVTAVSPGSPAADAGVLVGDQVLRVDGAPFSRPEQLTGDTGSKVVVVLLRQGKEMPMIMYRKVIPGMEPQAAPVATPAPVPEQRIRRK